LKVAEGSLPAYSHRFSPKKFTLHQLFACPVLKDFYGLAYRGTRPQKKHSRGAYVTCDALSPCVRAVRSGTGAATTTDASGQVWRIV
jgi:hypothetical protein